MPFPKIEGRFFFKAVIGVEAQAVKVVRLEPPSHVS